MYIPPHVYVESMPSGSSFRIDILHSDYTWTQSKKRIWSPGYTIGTAPYTDLRYPQYEGVITFADTSHGTLTIHGFRGGFILTMTKP